MAIIMKWTLHREPTTTGRNLSAVVLKNRRHAGLVILHLSIAFFNSSNQTDTGILAYQSAGEPLPLRL